MRASPSASISLDCTLYFIAILFHTRIQILRKSWARYHSARFYRKGDLTNGYPQTFSNFVTLATNEVYKLIFITETIHRFLVIFIHQKVWHSKSRYHFSIRLKYCKTSINLHSDTYML